MNDAYTTETRKGLPSMEPEGYVLAMWPVPATQDRGPVLELEITDPDGSTVRLGYVVPGKLKTLIEYVGQLGEVYGQAANATVEGIPPDRLRFEWDATAGRASATFHWALFWAMAMAVDADGTEM